MDLQLPISNQSVIPSAFLCYAYAHQLNAIITLHYSSVLFLLSLRADLSFIRLCAANVQERLVFKKDFLILIFAAIIQERLLFESAIYWRGYGNLLFTPLV